jgi:hypothetical protein
LFGVVTVVAIAVVVVLGVVLIWGGINTLVNFVI